MDNAVLTGIFVFEVVPVVCLGGIIASFWIKRIWVKILVIVPSALVLSGVILFFWAMRGLGGIKG